MLSYGWNIHICEYFPALTGTAVAAGEAADEEGAKGVLAGGEVAELVEAAVPAVGISCTILPVNGKTICGTEAASSQSRLLAALSDAAAW